MSTAEFIPVRHPGDARVRVRAMTADDLDAVEAIELASYTMPWSRETFAGLLRREDAETLVAEVDGAVIGYGIFWWVLDQAELGNVAVSASWRCHGVGELLVRTVLQRARRRGVRELFLEVRPSNHSARRLYERLGFAAAGRRRHYYVKPDEDAVVMRRPLEGS